MEDTYIMIIGEGSDDELWPEDDIIEYDFGDGEILRVYG